MKYLPLLLLVLCFACKDKQIPFDKNKWNHSIDGFFTYREFMVKDLLTNRLSVGMPFKEIQALLGEQVTTVVEIPNRVGYELSVDYRWDIDPVAGKTLFIDLGKDSTLVYAEVEAWEH